MSIRFISAFLLAILFNLSACSDSSTNDIATVNGDEVDQANELMSDLLGEDNEEQTWERFIDISIPDPMQPIEHLNPDAIAQYAYIAELYGENGDTTILEHYLVVVMHEKSSISGYPDSLNLDAMKYRNDVFNNLANAPTMERLTLLTKEPVIEKINNQDCVRNEFTALIKTQNNPVELYYKLAIFEAEKGFYQVMTWCPKSQKNTFQKDMDLIIDSFKEI